ncbi:hypothetical protein V1524DRAFT_480167 [Lipomyces starkeyi]
MRPLEQNFTLNLLRFHTTKSHPHTVNKYSHKQSCAMVHETATGFRCFQCHHAPFNSKTQLSKHISARHRRVTSIIVNGESYALAAPEGSSKYPCPKCDRETTSLSALKRHLAHNCQEVRQVTRPTAPDAGPDAIPEQETVTAAFNLEGLNSYSLPSFLLETR